MISSILVLLGITILACVIWMRRDLRQSRDEYDRLKQQADDRLREGLARLEQES